MDTQPKLPITVLIPVKNEEANLPRCLASVTWASEVIVIDSASTDRTATIARQLGAQVVQFPYSPPWPKKKQWALDNLPVKNDWIFLLDADEVLPPSASGILFPIVKEPIKENSPLGYWVDRRFYFLGQPLRHAYTPNWNLRLFRRGSCHFERLSSIETHSGDNEVHEHLICCGPTARLPQLVMDHYAFPTVEVFMEKHLRYAAWEAAVELHPHRNNIKEKLSPTVALRRFIKNLSRHLPGRPLWRFLWVYWFQKAFLDGPAGYTFARCHAVYEHLIAIKKRELKLKELKK